MFILLCSTAHAHSESLLSETSPRPGLHVDGMGILRGLGVLLPNLNSLVSLSGNKATEWASNTCIHVSTKWGSYTEPNSPARQIKSRREYPSLRIK